MITRAVTIAVVLLVPTPSVGLARPPVRQDDGKTLFTQNCTQCHGARGIPPKAMKTAFPKLPTFDAAFVAAHSADSIVKVLTHGKSTNMPSFKGKLTTGQMTTIANYVRGLPSA
jgi:mono/diheme cytochrome c family protein